MILLDFFRRLLRHIAAFLIFPSAFKAVPGMRTASDHEVSGIEPICQGHSLGSLKNEIMQMFRQPCSMRRMLSMSSALRIQYKARLQDSEACMLPSFCHSLPSGQEKGTFVCLDVGGSTFRVALVELRGRNAQRSPMAIRHMISSKIDERIRRLPSAEFFDWMAGKIEKMLKTQENIFNGDQIVPVGLTWSFPIEQTSHRSGKMQDMGKGFSCHEDTIGMDLGKLLEDACTKRMLNVRVDAIVNDSSATLLSQAYLDPATSMGLVLGTGTNAAAYLPTSALGSSKFGSRGSSWFDKADKVITNTEVSMFGKGILPQTRWDETLNKQHKRPDFQPLEYMTTGRYLGELFRLVLIEAVQTGELFDGVMPAALDEPYSVDTELLARLEQDPSKDHQDSSLMIKSAFDLPVTPSETEISFLRTVATSISYRASAYTAVAVHALLTLQRDVNFNLTTTKATSKTSVACNGSVILKYPGFKDRCESLIEEMIMTGSPSTTERIVLQSTDEAAIFGAAVAVALADDW